MTKGLILALSMMTGCAPTRQVFNYPNFGFSIVKDSIAETNKNCDGAAFYDDGEPRVKGSAVLGCWSPGKRVIRVRDTYEGCKALVHELGHADGSYTRKEVEDQFEWED